MSATVFKVLNCARRILCVCVMYYIIHIREKIFCSSVSLLGYPCIKSPDWALWIPKCLHFRPKEKKKLHLRAVYARFLSFVNLYSTNALLNEKCLKGQRCDAHFCVLTYLKNSLFCWQKQFTLTLTTMDWLSHPLKGI